MNGRRLLWLLILIYAALIAWLSLTPGSASEPLFPHDDKFFHCVAYLVFVFVCMPLMKTRRLIFLVAFSIFCFSGLMELGQVLVPMREPSWLDLLANTSGILLGVLIKNRRTPSDFQPQKSPH